jgi:hypothetical protein
MTNHIFNDTVHTFCLSISLRVESRGRRLGDTHQATKLSKEMTGKPGVTVTDQFGAKTMMSYHGANVQLRKLFRCDRSTAGDNTRHLGQFVNED